MRYLCSKLNESYEMYFLMNYSWEGCFLSRKRMGKKVYAVENVDQRTSFPLLVFPFRGHQQKIKKMCTYHPFVMFKKLPFNHVSMTSFRWLLVTRDGTPTRDQDVY